MSKRLTGRQLDAVVAERIFGLRNVRQLGNLGSWVHDDVQSGRKEVIAFHHENMGDAWPVAEWVVAQGYHIEMSVDKESTNVEIWEDDAEFPSYWNIIVDEYAATPTEAICYAALELKERLAIGG